MTAALKWSVGRPAFIALMLGVLPACSPIELDVGGDVSGVGDACGEDVACADQLRCEPTAEGESLCAVPVELHGRVIEAGLGTSVAGARVTALDRSGAPVGEVVITDGDGTFELPVRTVRDASGTPVAGELWTLHVTAQDFLPFPFGIQPALPIPLGAADPAMFDDASDSPLVVQDSTTTVELVRLPPAWGGGITLSGTVLAPEPGGTLVVVEADDRSVYALADAVGAYVVFNVQPGAVTVQGYRSGVELEPRPVIVGIADVEKVDLAALETDPTKLGRVTGQVSIVNAPGASRTSVVLIPSSVFDETLERGPVPFGLRAPSPPQAPDVSGAFEITGVPAGTYRALAAHENDGLVRDPDESIAGTAIPEVTVGAGQAADIADGFKITEALLLTGPGADGLEELTAPPVFRWADDSGESGYEIVVFDALGSVVWQDLLVPEVTGTETVEVPYGGPPLQLGLVHQFRATAVKSSPQGNTPITRTEDKRGVFVIRE